MALNYSKANFVQRAARHLGGARALTVSQKKISINNSISNFY